MVLRGSETRPDSPLVDVKSELARARDILKQAEDSLQEQRIRFTGIRKESLPEELRSAGSSYVQQQDFMEAISVLTARLELLERQKLDAQRKVFELSVEQERTLKQLACGGCAGVVSRTTVAPMDRVKILLQTQAVLHQNTVGGPRYGGIAGTLRTVMVEEGIGKLWRGNATNCIRIFPYASLQFWSYDYYKGRIMRSSKNFGLFERFQAGAMAGSTAAALTYPLDLVRIRLATNTDPALATLGGQLKNIIAENGPRGLYKGFIPTLTSLSPFIAINFATMDTLKTRFMPKKVKNEIQRSAIVLACGASSAIIAQTFCYPLDTVRRRMQVRGSTYTSMFNAYSTIIAQEGFKGLYKGILPNTVKIVPNNGIRWLAYTYFCKMMNVEPRKKK